MLNNQTLFKLRESLNNADNSEFKNQLLKKATQKAKELDGFNDNINDSMDQDNLSADSNNYPSDKNDHNGRAQSKSIASSKTGNLLKMRQEVLNKTQIHLHQDYTELAIMVFYNNVVRHNHITEQVQSEYMINFCLMTMIQLGMIVTISVDVFIYN